jgi:hypothetical protein
MRIARDDRHMATSFGVFGLCVALGTLAFGPRVEAKATYTVLPAGTGARSINDSGAIAGNEGLAGFLRTPDGSITTFHVTGEMYGTLAMSINADDTVAGFYIDASVVSHGFVRTADGSIATFDAPGAGTGSDEGTFAYSINTGGTVAGTFFDGNGKSHGFVRTPEGNITTIDVGGKTGTQVSSINDKGEIAGNYGNAGAAHGFLRTPQGKTTTFDAPGDNSATFVNCINSKGAVAGNYVDSSSVVHGYIRAADGTFKLFDAPGLNTNPTGINSKGVVVGAYSVNNQRRSLGFIRKTNGVVGKIRPPGATSGTTPMSINASGLIAGYFSVRVNKNEYELYGFIRTP